jgi:hypothetical protein
MSALPPIGTVKADIVTNVAPVRALIQTHLCGRIEPLVVQILSVNFCGQRFQKYRVNLVCCQAQTNGRFPNRANGRRSQSGAFRWRYFVAWKLFKRLRHVPNGGCSI